MSTKTPAQSRPLSPFMLGQYYRFQWSSLLSFGHRLTGIGLTFGTALLAIRSEEHTSELQSLMRISYAVFCLKKKKATTPNTMISDIRTYTSMMVKHLVSNDIVRRQ